MRRHNPDPTPWGRPKKKCPTLRIYLDAYIKSRSDVAATTRKDLEDTRDALLTAFHGPNLTLEDITPGDADRFVRFLRGTRKGENTVRKFVAKCKQVWRAAIRDNYLSLNPWYHIPSSTRKNPSRSFFVTRETMGRILEAAPNTRWRAIFALARYGGLRCPSELAQLRWSDVDWAKRRFTVHSPKMVRILGHDQRAVPIFPELAPYLEACRDIARDEWVISPPVGPCENLHQPLRRILHRLKIEPWPKLWINMRASRDTELHDQFPPHVVAAWMGHSIQVSMQFYAQVVEHHFQRAVETTQPSGMNLGGSGMSG